MLQFSETLQQVLDCQGVLHAALEKGFVAIIEGFLREELADATDFRKETWQHGEAYETLLGRALEHSGGPPERLRLQLQARARRARGNWFGVRFGLGVRAPSTPPCPRPPQESRLRFELSRFELVKYLNQVDAKKKFRLMEAINASL